MGDEKSKLEINKKNVLYGVGAFILIIVFINVFVGGQTPAPTTEKVIVTEQAKLSSEQAQKELDQFMSTAKKAGLVTSYDFSKLSESTYRWDIFVGKTWYTETVQQKKDFIAYIGMRKEAITGYTHFELRDAYTNEKVGEIKSFSRTIEVYK